MTTLRTMPMIWNPSGQMFGRRPCACCGKELKGRVFVVHVIRGGSDVLHPDSEAAYEEDAGEMGFHEIGSGCAQKFPGFAKPMK
jgi:hypothetical protein